MQNYPPTGRQFTLQRPAPVPVFTGREATQALKSQNVNYLEPQDPSETITSPVPELLSTNIAGAINYNDGFKPSVNDPGATYPMKIYEPHPATVAADVDDDDDSVKVTLLEDGSTQDVTLLLPNGLAIQDCVPQWDEDDKIMVFKTRDGQWFTGPFIPKIDIKTIFECP